MHHSLQVFNLNVYLFFIIANIYCTAKIIPADITTVETATRTEFKFEDTIHVATRMYTYAEKKTTYVEPLLNMIFSILNAK